MYKGITFNTIPLLPRAPKRLLYYPLSMLYGYEKTTIHINAKYLCNKSILEIIIFHIRNKNYSFHKFKKTVVDVDK